MSVPTSVSGTTDRTTVLRALAGAAGALHLLAWGAVGAFPMAVLLGLPPVVAALVWRERPGAAAVLAGLPAAVVTVWWAFYVPVHGFDLDPLWQTVWFVLAGPVAAVLLVAVLTRALRNGFRSGTPAPSVRP
jgi:hypothetical protein